MCGISAIAGHGNITPKLVDTLKKLEYRGYDSCGIFVYDGQKSSLKKNIGEVSQVAENENFLSVSGSIGISHTRWATHGTVSQENAHPFYSNDNNFILVHNGIISNYKELKDQLINEGYTFSSETDSEVFVNLVQKYFKETNDVEKAFVKSLNFIEGHYSFALFSIHEPTKIFAVKKDSPLIIGLGDGINYLTSDINAFLEWTRDAVVFDDEEYIILSNTDYTAKNIKTGRKVEKKIMSVHWDSEAAQKGGFEHYMIKEIFEQSQTIRKSLSIPKDTIDHVAKMIADNSQNCFLGVGTTYYVSLYGSYLFNRLTGKSIVAHSTDEAMYLLSKDNNKHLIFISQSGETYDTRLVVKEAKKMKAKTTSIVNVVGSSISLMTDQCIHQASGPEISVVSTKAAMSQMIILHRLALKTAYLLDKISSKELDRTEKKIYEFSEVINQVINQQTGNIRKLAEKYVAGNFNRNSKLIKNWLYLGKGIYYPIALEASLKMKEITYLHAEGMSAGFLKHGTLSLVDETVGSFFFMPSKKDEELYTSTFHAVQEVKARNGLVLCFASQDDKILHELCDEVIILPDIEPYLLPYYELIISQLFAYYSAIMLQRNVDKPRNLAKSVTVA